MRQSHPVVVSTVLAFFARRLASLQRVRRGVTLVVLQGMPLFFDKRSENHDVCVEPVLAFRFLLTKGL